MQRSLITSVFQLLSCVNTLALTSHLSNDVFFLLKDYSEFGNRETMNRIRSKGVGHGALNIFPREK